MYIMAGFQDNTTLKEVLGTTFGALHAATASSSPDHAGTRFISIEAHPWLNMAVYHQPRAPYASHAAPATHCVPQLPGPPTELTPEDEAELAAIREEAAHARLAATDIAGAMDSAVAAAAVQRQAESAAIRAMGLIPGKDVPLGRDAAAKRGLVPVGAGSAAALIDPSTISAAANLAIPELQRAAGSAARKPGRAKSRRRSSVRIAAPLPSVDPAIAAKAAASEHDMGLSLEDGDDYFGQELAAELGIPARPDLTSSPKKPAKSRAQPSLAESKANAAAAKRMARATKFLKNPRYQPNSGDVNRQLAKATRMAQSTRAPGAAQGEVQLAGVEHDASMRMEVEQNSAIAGVQPLLPSDAAPGEARAGAMVVRPAAVKFHEFTAGDQYETVITVRNTDHLSRSLRVLPPSTKYFATSPLMVVGAPKGTPVPSALAPGMAVRFKVFFKPTSLAHVADELILVTEAGKYALPLAAARPSPELTLPADIESGLCLPNDVVVTRVPMHNAGAGPGKWRIIPQEQWPNPPSVPPAYLKLGPFTVSPVELSVMPGDTQYLEVRFAPDKVGEAHCQFYLLADTCECTEHVLHGRCTPLQLGISAVGSSQVLATKQASPATLARRARAARAATHALLPAPERLVPGAHAAATAELAKAMLAAGPQFAAAWRATGTSPEQCNSIAARAGLPCAPALTFTNCAPGASVARTVEVRNDSAMPVKYSWLLVTHSSAAPELSMRAASAAAGRASSADEQARPPSALRSRLQDALNDTRSVLARTAVQADTAVVETDSAVVDSCSGVVQRKQEPCVLQVCIPPPDLPQCLPVQAVDPPMAAHGDSVLETAPAPSVAAASKSVEWDQLRAAESEVVLRRGGAAPCPVSDSALFDSAGEAIVGSAAAALVHHPWDITPASGVLQPGEAQPVTVRFMPAMPGGITGMLRLLVEDLPNARVGRVGKPQGIPLHADLQIAPAGGWTQLDGPESGGQGGVGSATLVVNSQGATQAYDGTIPRTRATALMVPVRAAAVSGYAVAAPASAELATPLMPGASEQGLLALHNPSATPLSFALGVPELEFTPSPDSRYAPLAEARAAADGASTGDLAAPRLRVCNAALSAGDVVPDFGSAAVCLEACAPLARTPLAVLQDELLADSASDLGELVSEDGVRSGGLPASSPSPRIAVPELAARRMMLDVVPRVGLLQPGATVNLRVTFRAPAALGKWRAVIPAHIFAGDVAIASTPSQLMRAIQQPGAVPRTLAPIQQLPLRAAATVVPCSLALNSADVDCGLARAGDEVTRTVRVRNVGAQPAAWRMSHVPRPDALPTDPDGGFDGDSVVSGACSSVMTFVGGAGGLSPIRRTRSLASLSSPALAEHDSALSPAARLRSSVDSPSGGASVASGSTLQSVVDDGAAIMCYPNAGWLGPGESTEVEVVVRTGRSRQRIRELVGLELVTLEDVLGLTTRADVLWLWPQAAPAPSTLGSSGSIGSIGSIGSPPPLFTGQPALPPAAHEFNAQLAAAIQDVSATAAAQHGDHFGQVAGSVSLTLWEELTMSQRNLDEALRAAWRASMVAAVHVRGEVQHPLAALGPASVDVGMSFLGQHSIAALQLHNMCNLPADFAFEPYPGLPVRLLAKVLPKLRKRVAAAGQALPARRFMLAPAALGAQGLTPSASKVSFMDAHSSTADAVIDSSLLDGENGQPLAAAVEDLVADVAACLQALDRTWADVLGAEAAVQLQGMLGAAGLRYRVEFEPSVGSLAAQSRADIQLTITPLLPGQFRAPIACDVRGVMAPLGSFVSGRGRPLTMALSARGFQGAAVVATEAGTAAQHDAFVADLRSDEEAVQAMPLQAPASIAVRSMAKAFDGLLRAGGRIGHLPCLDFGDAFETFSRRTCTLTLHNMSDIPTDVQAMVEKYPAWQGEQVERAAAAQTFDKRIGAMARSHRAPVRPGTDDDTSSSDEGDMLQGPLLSAVAGTPLTPASVAPHANTPWLSKTAYESANRLQSGVGRAAMRARDEAAVMQELLSLRNGVAFVVKPARLTVPPFGTATVSVTAVADFPADYEDSITLRIDGHDPFVVPMTARVQGTPLRFMPAAAGLSVLATVPWLDADRAAAVRASLVTATAKAVGQDVVAAAAAAGVRLGHETMPLLNFGVHPRHGDRVMRELVLENTSPMDAHVQWRLLHDSARAPLLVQVHVRARPGGSGVHTDISPAEEPALEYEVPFSVLPSRMVVPAHGTTRVVIQAQPVPKSEQAEQVDAGLGWPADDEARRARLVADALWVPAGTAPPERQLSELHSQPGGFLPAAKLQAELLDLPEVQSVLSEEESEAGGSEASSSSSLPGPVVHTGATGAGLSSDTIKTRITRAITQLRLCITPTEPRLSVDKAPSSSGKAVVKFACVRGVRAGHPSTFRQITLTNDFGAPLSFNLRTTGPFRVAKVRSNAAGSAKPGRARTTGQDMRAPGGGAYRTLTLPGAGSTSSGGAGAQYWLPAQHNMIVDVAFLPEGAVGGPHGDDDARSVLSTTGTAAGVQASADVVRAAAVAFFSSHPAGPGAAAGATMRVAGGSGDAAAAESKQQDAAPGLKSDDFGGLHVAFSSGSVQDIVLRAEAVAPCLVVSPPLFNFGQLALSRVHTTTLWLSNPTSAPAFWELRHVPAQAARRKVEVALDSLGLDAVHWSKHEVEPAGSDALDDPTVFSFSAQRGVVAGPTAPPTDAEVAALRRARFGVHRDGRVVHELDDSSDSDDGSVARAGLTLRQARGSAADILRADVPAAASQAVPLEVAFTPKAAAKYECRFRVEVRRGATFDVVLRGSADISEEAQPATFMYQVQDM